MESKTKEPYEAPEILVVELQTAACILQASDRRNYDYDPYNPLNG